jgi:hypothetical protein
MGNPCLVFQSLGAGVQSTTMLLAGVSGDDFKVDPASLREAAGRLHGHRSPSPSRVRATWGRAFQQRLEVTPPMTPHVFRQRPSGTVVFEGCCCSGKLRYSGLPLGR